MFGFLTTHPLKQFFVQTVRNNHNRQLETYYDILKVRKDSSGKEIRNAFLQLSKKYHPDVKSSTPDSKQNAQFLKIAEAYQTLSKPSLRLVYDQNLWARTILHSENTTKQHRKYPKCRPRKMYPEYKPPSGIHEDFKVQPKQDTTDQNNNNNNGYNNPLNGFLNSKLALTLLALGMFGVVMPTTFPPKPFKLLDKKCHVLLAQKSPRKSHSSKKLKRK